MKKTVTKSYETVVCDICGQEEDFAIHREMKNCPVCSKDMCSLCEVFIRFLIEKDRHSTRVEKYFCKEHLPDLLKICPELK